MSYDNMYRITGKTQDIRQTGIQFSGTLNAGYGLAYAYDRTPGRRFRMSSVSDVNYRTVGAPEDGDYIDEEHFYEYDPNGNILHVNTGRWKRDGVERELSREEKFRWDEENRLMAISQDGYVSNYWYDGDGERVIKEHGGNQAVFVNSGQDGVLTDTRQFTIYPSAYLVVHNGSWYTKHVYIGSERIASRMGTMLVDELSETFEANAILAGENVLEEIDYDGKCDTLARVMRSNYAYFDLPYNGENRHGDEMVSTPPQSGDPGILGAGGARHYWMLADADAADADGEVGGPSRGPRRAENVNYNGNRYFYHSDHLGSSMLITDASGNVTQQLDYLPYGEVFLEKRANVDYHTPYKFNGKELDEETGLYYYGARYMNPRLSIWYATDPLQEDYPYVSTYTYTYCNPILIIDPNGESVKVSEFFKDMGININPFYSGVIDGVAEASPVGLVTLIYDLSTDAQYREDAKEAIKELYQHPIESLEQFVGNKIETYKSAINGHCSEENQYEIGTDVGNVVGSVLMGGGIKKFIDILKNRRYSNVIYKVPGDATSSGKPYIGRTNDLRRRRTENRDGRDRTKAKVIGRYDPQKPKSGAIAEQNAMNKHGGVKNLDNKRNEIRESDWGKYKIKPIKKKK
jgi:RHS repeat-associated protein